MENNLELYGWGSSGNCSIDTTNNQLQFIEKSYITNENTFQNNRKKVIVSAKFMFKEVDNGLVLWYNNTIGQLIFSTDGIIFELKRTFENREIALEHTSFDALVIIPPIVNEEIELKTIINGSHILCYYNDVLVIEAEDNTFSEGYFGLYGEANALCSSFSLETNKISEWITYVENGTSINRRDDADGRIEINITDDSVPKKAYIYQDFNITTPGNHTVSMDYIGGVYIQVLKDGVAIADSTFTSLYSISRDSLTFNIPTAGIITILIGSETKGTHSFTEPQLEFRSFNTSFTDSTRDSSKVTFPVKELNTDLASISFWIIPKHDYSIGSLPLFYYNDSFRLDYNTQNFILTYGSKTISVLKTIEANKKYHISCSWENQDMAILNIHDEDLDEDAYDYVSLDLETIMHSDYMYLGSNANETGNLTLDNLLIINGLVTVDELLAVRFDSVVTMKNIVVHCTFNKESLIYDGNVISVPIARSDSPIIIQAESGINYDRVYFVEDGKYTINYKEIFTYEDEIPTFKIKFDNIVKANVYTKNRTKIFEDVKINGNLITVNDPDLIIGEEIIISYILKNTYCINYIDEFDQYEMQLSNTDGSDIVITYQDKEGRDRKLVRTVELNPFKSVNNYGFIYIEDVARELETFDIKITPDSLVADGYDVATITIDCLSKGGAPTSNVAKYEFTTDTEGNEIIIEKHGLNVTSALIGEVPIYVSPEEDQWNKYAEEYGEEAAIKRYGHFITDEHRSGRFIYKYKAPRILREEGIPSEVIDKITITDRVSEIGVQIPIRLVRE